MLRGETHNQTHLDSLTNHNEMVDNIAHLLAHTCTSVLRYEDGGCVLNHHKDEKDEPKGLAGGHVILLRFHGNVVLVVSGVILDRLGRRRHDDVSK